MKLIFYIKGGAGKVLAATPAVIKRWNVEKITNPETECIVVSHYPDLWDNLGITALDANTLENFYRDYVAEKDNVVYASDPYDDGEYIMRRINLVEAYFKIYDIRHLYEYDLPLVKFTDEEIADVDETLGPFSDKPPIAIQISGGPENQNTSFSWARDLHVSQAEPVVNVLKERFNVFQIRRDDQPAIPGIHTFSGSRREIMAFLSRCRGGIFIDSFGQHAAAAVRLKSVVLYIGTNPEQAGYTATNTHLNIISKAPKNKDYPKNAIFYPYHLWGDPFECPYDNPEMFDLQEIINALVYQVNENEDSSN